VSQRGERMQKRRKRVSAPAPVQTKKNGRPTSQVSGTIRVAKKVYLEALKRTGSNIAACKEIGIHRNTPYGWAENDGEFAEQMKTARTMGEQGIADELEQEAHRRAMGYEVPQWFQGKIVGKTPMYSDNLLMFTLKGLRPEKYKEGNFQMLHAGDIRIQIVNYTGPAYAGSKRHDNEKQLPERAGNES